MPHTVPDKPQIHGILIFVETGLVEDRGRDPIGDGLHAEFQIGSVCNQGKGDKVLVVREYHQALTRTNIRGHDG